MKITISSLPVEGVELNFDLEIEQLKAGLRPDDRLFDAFVRPAEVNARAQRMHDYVDLSGDFRVQLKPVCDRCLESFLFPFKQQIRLTCVPESMTNDEDEGLFPYKHDKLDLAEVVRSQLMSNIPMVFHCSAGCKGLCTDCGKNLNQETCDCKSRVQQA